MNKEAVQRLREPVAWILLVSAGLQLLAGIVRLFTGGGVTWRSLDETLGAGTFQGVALTLVLVVAVLLATWAGPPTPQARNIVMGALGVFGGAALFGVITWLAGLMAGSGDAGSVSAGLKFSAFLYGAAKLAVLATGGWFTFTVFQGMQPPRRAQVPPGYPPGYGYQQSQPGQAAQPAQPGQPGQPGQQQYGGYQQQPADQQQAYDQQYQQYPQGYQQQAYEQGGQYDPQQYQQQQQPSFQQPAEGESEWTRAYGDQPYGQQQGEQPQEGGRDWYRDNRPRE